MENKARQQGTEAKPYTGGGNGYSIGNDKFLFKKIFKLDLAFNNVKPKDWYFVLD